MQKNWGIGNSNFEIRIENGALYLGPNNTKCDATILWELLINQFDEYDREINRRLPENLLYNKTAQREKYDSSKIISSLLKIGIPLPATLEVAKDTITQINQWIDDTRKEETLSTKIVRQFVSLSIRNLDISKWSRPTVEKWNAKYVRRYGHNNRIVQIYNIPSDVFPEKIVDISYSFITKYFLVDLIHTVAPNINIKREISTNNLGQMAEEVISFINGCDLYAVNYSVLKSIIMEIATQMPHPWIVDEQKRADTIHYDRDSVEKNLNIAQNNYRYQKPLPTSVATELLHHASSMVLEKYFSFLGCEDLTSFYRLLDIVQKLVSNDWESVLSDYSFRLFCDDCTFAGVDIERFKGYLGEIDVALKNSDMSSLSFTATAMEFAKCCLQIERYGNKEKVECLLNSDWGNYSVNEICESVQSVLQLIFPRGYLTKRNDPNSHHFWVKYRNVNGEWGVKPTVFVMVANSNNMFDFSVLTLLSKRPQTLAVCNTIFFVIEYFQDFSDLIAKINSELATSGLSTKVTPVLFDKFALQRILSSNNRPRLFDQMMNKQMIDY